MNFLKKLSKNRHNLIVNNSKKSNDLNLDAHMEVRHMTIKCSSGEGMSYSFIKKFEEVS